jgi:hypothetical protein
MANPSIKSLEEEFASLVASPSRNDTSRMSFLPESKIIRGERFFLSGAPMVIRGALKNPTVSTAFRGMGDALAFAGLCVYLSRFHGKVFFPCNPKNELSVRSVFVHHPEIEVIGLDTGKTMAKKGGSLPPVISLVFDARDVFASDSTLDMYQRVYEKFDVPYSARWDDSPIPEAVKSARQQPVPKGKYVFIHSDPSRGYDISTDRLPAYIPRVYARQIPGMSILSYAEVIEHAEEIHCIDSAFFHLSEQLHPRGKLFLHRSARSTYVPVLKDYMTRHNWIIINN